MLSAYCLKLLEDVQQQKEGFISIKKRQNVKNLFMEVVEEMPIILEPWLIAKNIVLLENLSLRHSV